MTMTEALRLQPMMMIYQRVLPIFDSGISESATSTPRAFPAQTAGHGDTTIRGHASCGTGILNNALYAGVLSWNRKRYFKDPATGRKVARLNPEAEWIEALVPHLRIVDDEAVRAQQAVLMQRFEATTAGMLAARARKFNELRRPVHLLSGLLECGVCGGGYGIVVKDRYGCINRNRHGTCTNPRSIRRPHLEERALAGIRDRLVSPEKVEAAVRAYA